MTDQLDDLADRLKALGTPGDHGYDTTAGKALFLAHQIMAEAYAARHHLTLPLDMEGKQWRVGESCGEVFEDEEEYDGLTLTVELRGFDEAKAVLAAILGEDGE